MTLYELTGQYLQLLAYAEDPEVDPQVIADTLEALDGDIEEKADGYAKVIRQLKADAEALKVEIDRLTARKRAIEGNVDRMMESLKNAMILCEKPKFKTELFTFGVQNNPPKVVIDDPENIPQYWLIQQDPKVNTSAIKEAIQNGDPFAANIAHLEQGQSLRIR